MAEKLVLDLRKKLQLPQNQPAREPCYKSINRVPKLASFGPYHHNHRYLLPMEVSKSSAVLQFHRRIARASKTPDDVLIAMRKVLPCLIASYDGLQVEDEDGDYLEPGRFRHGDWVIKKDEFLKIMIVNGCFALEIMLADKRSAAEE